MSSRPDRRDARRFRRAASPSASAPGAAPPGLVTLQATTALEEDVADAFGQRGEHRAP